MHGRKLKTPLPPGFFEIIQEKKEGGHYTQEEIPPNHKYR